MERKLIGKWDILVITALLAIALLGYFNTRPSSVGIAVITLDGEIAARLPLNRSGSFEYPEMPGVVFTVENGAVSISENDCPDLVCVRTGAIKSGAVICLPKKIAVTVETVDSDGLDAVM